MGQSFSSVPVGGRLLTRKEDIAEIRKFWILTQSNEVEGLISEVTPWFDRGPEHKLLYPAKLKGFSVKLSGSLPTANFLIRAKRRDTGEWDRIFCAKEVQKGKVKHYKFEDNILEYTSIHIELFEQGSEVELNLFGRVVGPETPLSLPPVDLVQAGNGGMIVSCTRDPLEASRLIHPDTPTENDGWYMGDKVNESEEHIIISLAGPSIINYIELINPDPERQIKVFGGNCDNKEAVHLDDWVKLCGSMMNQTHLPVHTDPKTQKPFDQAWTHLLVCFYPGVSLSRIHAFGWAISRPHAKTLTEKEVERNITYGLNK